MKILMLGWELPPHNSGGLGVACYQLCKTLANRGIDIEFIVPYSAEHRIDFMKVTAARPDNVHEIIKGGIAYDSYKYIYDNGSEEWLSIFEQQQIYEQSVAKLTETMEFDVIHAHDWLTCRAAMRAKERSGKALIVHFHSIESDRAGGRRGNPLVHDIEYNALMMADRIVAVSNFTKKGIMRDYGIPADKIEVVHNSIDISLVEPLDDENVYRYIAKMKEQGYRVVTSVGRLTIQKGMTNLLYAAKEVIARQPKTLFLIVGNGELYQELITLAADLGIGKNVILTGFQRGKQWRDAFAVADLFVMPSVSEPFGMVALEAIGYGSPVLLSKQSGVAEVLKNALKVDFWDVNEMANQITSAIRSEEMRAELRRGARLEYERMSWENSANKVMALYQEHQAGAPA